MNLAEIGNITYLYGQSRTLMRNTKVVCVCVCLCFTLSAFSPCGLLYGPHYQKHGCYTGTCLVYSMTPACCSSHNALKWRHSSFPFANWGGGGGQGMGMQTQPPTSKWHMGKLVTPLPFISRIGIFQHGEREGKWWVGEIPWDKYMVEDFMVVVLITFIYFYNVCNLFNGYVSCFRQVLFALERQNINISK